VSILNQEKLCYHCERADTERDNLRLSAVRPRLGEARQHPSGPLPEVQEPVLGYRARGVTDWAPCQKEARAWAALALPRLRICESRRPSPVPPLRTVKMAPQGSYPVKACPHSPPMSFDSSEEIVGRLRVEWASPFLAALTYFYPNGPGAGLNTGSETQVGKGDEAAGVTRPRWAPRTIA
jgi:hypothetical protein